MPKKSSVTIMHPIIIKTVNLPGCTGYLILFCIFIRFSQRASGRSFPSYLCHFHLLFSAFFQDFSVKNRKKQKQVDIIYRRIFSASFGHMSDFFPFCASCIILIRKFILNYHKYKHYLYDILHCTTVAIGMKLWKLISTSKV